MTKSLVLYYVLCICLTVILTLSRGQDKKKKVLVDLDPSKVKLAYIKALLGHVTSTNNADLPCLVMFLVLLSNINSNMK